MPKKKWFSQSIEVNLIKQFKSPPKEFSMFPFWSWNDTLDPEKIRSQIDEMLDKSIHGAVLHARAGIEQSETPYFSEGWWKAVKTAVEYGAKKGFYTILYDEDKWPSGSAGGRVVAANPDFAKVGLKVEKWKIKGERRITLNFQGDCIAIFAARLVTDKKIDPSSIIDITVKKDMGWEVPKGQWAIMAFIEERDTGIQIDYLNKEAVAKFIEITHEEYYRRFAKYFGQTIPGIFFDEIYAHLPGAYFVWSKTFLEDFKQMRGYDLRPLLPHLIYDAGPLTSKVRCDYFDVFSSIFTEAWFNQIAEWCEDHHIWLTGHTIETIRDYWGQGNYFQQWSSIQIPGTDNEDYRYTFPRRIRWFKPKQISSLCHLYDKKRIAVEAMGGGGWVVTPEEYKMGILMLGVYGLNLFIPHLFHYCTNTPKSLEDWPPSWFHQNPYWKYFKKLSDLARRISFMNTQGNHICDMCILYPITTLWAQTTDKPQDAGTLGGGETGNLLEMQYNSIQETLLDNLFDYDIIDPHSIMRSECSQGKINVGQESYSILILPPLTTIRRDVINKIRSFYNNGGTVIALNRLPMASMEKGDNDGFVLNSCRDIFGFDLRSIRIGYVEIDQKFQKEYVVNTNPKGGRAYFTKWTKYLPEILSAHIDQHVTVVDGEMSGLHILHRRMKEKEIYFLVNEQKTSNSVRLSFRENGKPELWNPETGEIEEISNYISISDRIEIPLTFKPWQGQHIVFSPFKKKNRTMISKTSLHEAKITAIKGSKVTVEGWQRGDAEKITATVEKCQSGIIQSTHHESESKNQIAPITLDRNWRFIAAPKELDKKWLPEVLSSEIKLPVFKFHPEREGNDGYSSGWNQLNFNDTDWKQIKIKDSFSKDKGCKRYLSCWDGVWINYYRYDRHWGALGGKRVDFRRELTIDRNIDSGWICITADKAYELSINGKVIGNGSAWDEPDVYDITSSLTKGKNKFLVTVWECNGLLFQGEIRLTNGTKIQMFSDNKWEASNDKGVWLPAFSYIYPPLGPWGEIPMKDKEISFPVRLWYRQELPPGTKSMKAPIISGEYEIFINGHKIKPVSTSEETNISGFMTKGKNMLAVNVSASGYNDGLLEPIEVICEQVESKLGSWTEQGLHWYSGRAVYSNKFDLPPGFSDSDKRLVLELGDVRYCAEIWINNELAETKSWPPYSIDITDLICRGKNKISIIVANLLANQMMWDIHDVSLTSVRSRFNHQGAVFRQKERLKSGLIGPVRLVTYQKQSIEL